MTAVQKAELKKQIPTALKRLAALSLLSLTLGLTFNAANPTGVRFSENTEASGASAISENKSVATKDSGSPYENTTVLFAMTTPLKPSAPTKAASTITYAPAGSSAPSPKGQFNAGIEAQPISWDEAVKILGGKNSILVDARPKATFDAGHIPGAVSLPDASQPFDFAAFANKYSKDTVVITYCSNTECPVSLKLAAKLIHDYGYKTVRYMPGGYQEWQRHQATAKPGF